MTVSRRTFLRRTAAVSAGFAGLRELSWVYGDEAPEQIFDSLQEDPNGLLELPPGFGYRVLSRVEARMADGFLVPWAPDGMAAFPASNGRTLLLCNSEAGTSGGKDGPAGEQAQLLSKLPERLVYDPRDDDGQCLGGVTTIVYDTRTGQVEKQFLSLAGTVRNCAGGPTPWNSWITCEETTQRAEEGYAKDHGYNFEVFASEKQELQEPVPLVDMGRFVHEAVAVDPASGIVYQTEDRGDGLVYRFIPDRPGRLHEGGRLQALAALDEPSLDTRNWRGEVAPAAADTAAAAETAAVPEIAVGTEFPVRWVDIENVRSPEGDLHLQGFDKGAARFARGEGMWYGMGSVFFACTSGGHAGQGQVWRYTPSPHEGTAGEQGAGAGKLMLYAEPNDKGLVENADNLTVAPWGDVILCEDGGGTDRLVGIRPDGTFYELARTVSSSELAGATFSADGSTLFVNAQQDGVTMAITGPWPGG